MLRTQNSARTIHLVITKGNWGGAQTYVFDLAKKLHTDNYNVLVLHGAGTDLPEKLAACHINTSRLPHLGRDISLFDDIQTLIELYRVFANKHNKPDIVHLNSSKIGGIGALAARIAGIKKIIFTAHGFAFNEDRPYWQRVLLKILTWFTLLLNTDIICINQREYAQAKKFWFTKKKLHYIPIGIDMTEQHAPLFIQTKEKATDALGQKIGTPLPKHTPIIGTIAELTKNKGLVYAINAMQHIPDALYIIIGGGEDEEQLRQVIKEKKLERRVILTGFLPNAKQYLKAFDIFLLPSLKEGLPYTLLEAGSAFLTVVATDVGGIPELLGNNERGVIIPPKNSDRIAETIVTLLAHKPQREQYGVALGAHIQTYNFLHTYTKTVSVYNTSPTPDR